MKITTFIIFAVILQVSAAGFAQKVTLSSNNSRLTEVFNEIRNQTGYDFLFTSETLKDAKRVNIKVENAELKDVLNQLFTNQPLEYIINKKAVVVSKKETPSFLDRVVDAFTPPINVRGIVYDEKGGALPGVTIKVKGVNRATSTDNEGKFYLSSLDDDAVLEFRLIGYKTLELPAKGKLDNVRLEVLTKELEEVVVAYGKTTQQALTGAVTVVKGEQIENLPNRSFDKSLQGLVPGLSVISGNGQPGSGPGNFVLRGIATGGQPNGGETFRNPLIVIDGVPVSQDPPRPVSISDAGAPLINPIAQFNPSDIESISVLKDAAAVALYGSKASNGVILVVTKKGKVGKTVFNFRNQTDISGRLDGGVKMLTQQQYLELLYEAYKNSDANLWTDATILADLKSKFPVQPDGSFYSQSDWGNALFKKNALTLSNEIGVSGGNDRSNFYLNMEYTKQDGIAKNTGYDRKSTRFNYENRLSTALKVGLNTTLSYNDQKYNNTGTFERILRISPLNPIHNIQGEYIYNYGWGLGTSQRNLIPNPVAASELNINRNISYRGLSKLYGELKFLKYFSITSNLGFDYSLNEIKEKIHPLLAIDGRLDYGGTLKQTNVRNTNIINTNIFRFDIVAKMKHNISVLFGQESQILTNKSTEIYKYNFLTDPSTDQLQSGTVLGAIDVDGKQTMLSYFAQMNYGFADKYFLTGSVRTDGSSLFGKNRRFGAYWSIGGGWLLSEEAFLKKRVSWIDYLKVRGSFGPAGNSSAILNYLSYDYLRRTSSTSIVPDEGRNPGNPDIKWEETFTWDAGLEFRVLNERIGITADIYNRKTKNLIANNVPLPYVTGFGLFTTNVGDIRNRGVELSLSARIINYKNFSWNLSANWSRNKNTLTRSNLPQESAGISAVGVINKVGEEYNSFYLPEWAGVNPDNGRPMWIDTTGTPNVDFNAARYIIAGKAQPNGFGALTNIFSWKDFELSGMFLYQYGSHILLPNVLQNDGSSPYANQSVAALDRWQKPGDIAENPRRLLNGRKGSEIDRGATSSTKNLFKGDFVRLSNVTISYSLPKGILNVIKFNSLKLFIQGHNLVTWTPYSGQDPENTNSFGSGGFYYPQQRSFTIGLNAKF